MPLSSGMTGKEILNVQLEDRPNRGDIVGKEAESDGSQPLNTKKHRILNCLTAIGCVRVNFQNVYTV